MTTSASTAHSLPRILVVALLGPLSGIASAVEPAATAASATVSASLLVPITTLIGDAECDNQSQCHALGIGAKACGGPNSYLAWSEKKTDPSALRTAVEAHARAQMDENKTSGLISDCMVVPMPPAVCRPRASDGKKTCQLGQGGASSAI